MTSLSDNPRVWLIKRLESDPSMFEYVEIKMDVVKIGHVDNIDMVEYTNDLIIYNSINSFKSASLMFIEDPVINRVCELPNNNDSWAHLSADAIGFIQEFKGINDKLNVMFGNLEREIFTITSSMISSTINLL